jgi:biotin transport system permease protein
MNKSTFKRSYKLGLVQDSPLRRLDPRLKLAMGLCASLAVMLPLERLLVFMIAYGLFLVWARLWRPALRQVWRMKWILLLLFVLDVILVDLELAVIITLRLALLAGVFTLLFATTTPRELSQGLEQLRLPYRYAFSLGLAFQSLSLVDDEWRAIQEAQQSRGALRSISSWKQALNYVSDLVALTVPAVVLTTKRAWAVTESAYARGFDSPKRKPYHRLRFSSLDWLGLAFTVLVSILLFWR